jgi:hypothetical protein
LVADREKIFVADHVTRRLASSRSYQAPEQSDGSAIVPPADQQTCFVGDLHVCTAKLSTGRTQLDRMQADGISSHTMTTAAADHGVCISVVNCRRPRSSAAVPVRLAFTQL